MCDGFGATVVRIVCGLLAAPVWYIVEPFVWFNYVTNNRERFTPFEDAFFRSSAFCELLGQTVFLFLVVACGFSWRDPSFSPGSVLVGSRLLGNFVSSLPAFRWVTFESIWGFTEEHRNADLRKNLSSWCLSFTMVVIFNSFCDIANYPEDGFWPAFMVYWALLMYPITTYFAQSLMRSGSDRFCPGPLRHWFVGFRAFELVVVAPLIYIACAFFYN